MTENEINRLGGFYGQATRWGVYDVRYIAPTLTAAMGEGGGHVPMVLIAFFDGNSNSAKKEVKNNDKI